MGNTPTASAIQAPLNCPPQQDNVQIVSRPNQSDTPEKVQTTEGPRDCSAFTKALALLGGRTLMTSDDSDSAEEYDDWNQTG